jgi:endonuclease/exonuclease/phosphatase family metal-dependent hydrolase
LPSRTPAPRRRRLRARVTLAALTALAGTASALPAPAHAVRVMTWNVAGSPTNARVKAQLPFDVTKVEAVIRRADPDVVGLQEVCGWQAAAIGAALGYSVWPTPAIVGFADPRPGSGGVCDYGIALLARPPMTLDEPVAALLTDAGACKADARVPVPPGTPECRILQTATLNPGGVRVANTHVGVDATAPAQLRRFTTRAAQLAPPAVLLGDDNTQPQIRGLGPRLAAAGYLDAAGALPGLPCVDTVGCAPTFPAGGAFGAPALRADYVWHRGTRARPGAGRVDTTAGGVPASDHLALAADLRPVAGPSGGLAVSPRALRNLRQFGLAVTVGLDGPATVTTQVSASPQTVERLRLASGRLGSATAQATAPGALRLAVKPPRAAAAALRRAVVARLAVAVTLTGADGRRTRLPTRTITLRQGAPAAPASP